MSENLGLGKIITTPQAHRDAIHIAVAPVWAGERLAPGEHIGLNRHGMAVGDVDPQIGVVDPFLRETVEPGQCFWLYLYPGSITSLRHDWTHPAFDHTPLPKEQRASESTPLPKEERTDQRADQRTEQRTDQRTDQRARLSARLPEGPVWRTETVLRLAHEARHRILHTELTWDKQAEELGLLPLSDALEEAGYSQQEDLNLLRGEFKWSHDERYNRLFCLLLGGELEEAVHWIDSYCLELDQTWTKLMGAAERWEREGDRTYDNSETYKFVDRDKWTWATFWRYYELVQDRKLPETVERDNFFTCSC